jgi:archaemetzincin
MIESLTRRLEEFLGLPVYSRPPWFDPERAFDVRRGQYNSTILLEMLLGDPRENEGKLLGVTNVDLFIPVLTFVFGEAQLDGRAAVVSIHRLHNEAYGLPADEQVLQDRFEKEALHEIGHTFGLVHCVSRDCVMRSSTYVEEIDLKAADYCDECILSLRRRLV